MLGDGWFSDPNKANRDAGCDVSEPEDEVIDGLDPSSPRLRRGRGVF